MLACFEVLGCRMSLKVHFLHAHLDYFTQNLGNMSEKLSERIHQDIKSVETRYQGRLGVSMMTDYYWCLKRDCKSSELQEKPKEENSCLTSTSRKPDLVGTKLYSAIEQKCVLIWLITRVFE